MIDIQTLVDHVRTYNPKCNEDLIRRAYEYGKEKHSKQRRQSGELYFTHPIEVAIILDLPILWPLVVSGTPF